MAFFQGPPQLRNPYDEDPVLASYVRRKLGGGEHGPALEAELRELGEVAIEYYGMSLADRDNEPVLTQWDAWGQRIDHIEVSPLWKDAQRLASHHGMVAAAYEPTHGAGARIHQFAVVLVLGPSLDLYSCPLAMTDGAARTLLASGNAALINAYVPHLTTRDPAQMWTSGQWMTERTGGYNLVTPDTITLYQGPIEQAAAEQGEGEVLDRVREEVRHTVIHEIAHHFGIDDDRLVELGAY